MRNLHACPICSSSKLTRVGARETAMRHPPMSCFDGGNNVLLEFVLRRPSVKPDTMRCRICSHFFLTPTFDEEELGRLYSREALDRIKQQYRESEKASGLSWAEQNRIKPAEQQARLTAAQAERPRRLHALLQKLGLRPDAICDVGGMDGQLMSEFTQSRRYVYDRVPGKTMDSCTRLQSLDELESHAPYDLMVFSHVLEHVPDPRDFLTQYRRHLAPGGCFYLEVPLQYQGAYLKRRGIPLGEHVNYFTRPSLLQLSAETGMSDVILCRKEVACYGELRLPVLKLVCRASPGSRKSRSWWPWEVMRDTCLHFQARLVRR